MTDDVTGERGESVPFVRDLREQLSETKTEENRWQVEIIEMLQNNQFSVKSWPLVNIK